MGDSFLMRDKEGNVQGYIIWQGARICCRISGALRDGMLYLRDERLKEWMFELQNDGRENLFAYAGKKIKAAFVLDGNRLAYASDWYEQPPANCRKAETEAVKEKKMDSEEGVNAQKAPERQWPERRWPPPPCMTKARYEQGMWHSDL